MKKIFKHFTVLLIICCVLVSSIPFVALASSSMGISGATVSQGDSFSISVSISGDITGYDATIYYDSSILQYNSCSSGSSNTMFGASGGGGVITVSDMYTSATSGPMSFSISFTAIGSGNASISGGHTAYDINGNIVSPSTGGSATVTVSAPPTASSDATLSSLYISPGSLYPSFSSGTTYYSATVSASTTRLTVSAVPNDSGASVYVSGASSLSVGQNSVYVTVTAEDGTQQTYTINVTRNSDKTDDPDDPDDPDKDEKPDENQDIYVTVNGNDIMNVSPTIDPAIVPSGFVLTETQIDGKTVQALSYADDAPLVLYLISEDGAIQGFYFYNAETGDCTPMASISQPAFSFTALDQNSVVPPEGYVLGTFTIGDVAYQAFVPNGVETPDHCLIYGINSSGTIGFYIYDALDGTFQRYRFEDTSQIVIPEKEEEKEPEKEPDTKEEKALTPSEKLSALFSDPFTMWLMIGLGALVLILLILAVVFIVLYRKKAARPAALPEESTYTSSELYEPPVFDTTPFTPVSPVSDEQVTSILNENTDTGINETGSNAAPDAVPTDKAADKAEKPEPINLEDIQFDIPDFGGAGASIPEVEFPDKNPSDNAAVSDESTQDNLGTSTESSDIENK
jgi:hypothetical protein